MILKFDEFINEYSNIHYDIFEKLNIDEEELNEANIDNMNPVKLAGWLMFPYISLAKYLIRTAQKKNMIKKKLKEIEDPDERMQLKKELMALTKEELQAKMQSENMKKQREKEAKGKPVDAKEILKIEKEIKVGEKKAKAIAGNDEE